MRVAVRIAVVAGGLFALAACSRPEVGEIEKSLVTTQGLPQPLASCMAQTIRDQLSDSSLAALAESRTTELAEADAKVWDAVMDACADTLGYNP